MLEVKSSVLFIVLVLLASFARPTLAFGAGNIAGISKVEGQNWRHGDIEDALLALSMARVWGGKRFNKVMVARTYFGNWLRDYSQAIDVGTVKSVSAEAIRLLLSVLGFMTFGYGAREFEVTAARLGCYRPEDHIDNPRNYADNLDARRYHPWLRGPVDERVELAVDPGSGMKNYIANEQAGIATSAQHVRRLFSGCIELGRRYGRYQQKADLHEALRLMGTGLHCLEDFFAHSNYIELALIEMGETNVFPHVGRNTRIRLWGARSEVYPIVTGTFGGVDFLHSVTGEVSDKLTQNEVDELEGTLQQSSYGDTSILRNLLDMIPDGIFGGKQPSAQLDAIQSNAAAAQMQHNQVSPREPEQYTLYIQNIFRQIMPAIEFHDEIIQSISEAIERIPVLPKIIEQLEEQMSVFVFSIIAPFVVPVIRQVKNELKTGSNEVIQSSERQQHIVFYDDSCSDPTHSMLSKDHFSNILNEVAGRTAASIVQWVVPQLMQAIDDERIDPQRTINRIVHGVMHHPALRNQGDDGARDGRYISFQSVEQWWRSLGPAQYDYRGKLSREGIMAGANHKEGVHDTGHGCAGRLQMRKKFGAPETWEDRVASAAAGALIGGATSALSGFVQHETGLRLPTLAHPNAGQASGYGGLLQEAGRLFSDFAGGRREEFLSTRREADGGVTRSVTEYARDGDRYGQAELSVTQYPDGEERREFKEFEQDEDRAGGHTRGFGFEEERNERPARGGGFEERTERAGWQGVQEFDPRPGEEARYGGGPGQGAGYTGGYGGQVASARGGQGQEGGDAWGRQGERQDENVGGGFGDFVSQAASAAEHFDGAFRGEQQGEGRRWQ